MILELLYLRYDDFISGSKEYDGFGYDFGFRVVMGCEEKLEIDGIVRRLK